MTAYVLFRDSKRESIRVFNVERVSQRETGTAILWLMFADTPQIYEGVSSVVIGLDPAEDDEVSA